MLGVYDSVIESDWLLDWVSLIVVLIEEELVAVPLLDSVGEGDWLWLGVIVTEEG